MIDHGIGIDKNAIALIGTEYVPPAIVRGGDKEGSGLGLPVSIALMKAHGGALDIESAPSRGTTVTLRFPTRRLVAPVKSTGRARPQHAAAAQHQHRDRVKQSDGGWRRAPA